MLKEFLAIMVVGIFSVQALHAQTDSVIVNFLYEDGLLNRRKLSVIPDVYSLETNRKYELIKINGRDQFADSYLLRSFGADRIAVTIEQNRFIDGYLEVSLSASPGQLDLSVDLTLQDLDLNQKADYFEWENARRNKWLIGTGGASAFFLGLAFLSSRQVNEMNDNLSETTNDRIFMSRFAQSREDYFEEIKKIRRRQIWYTAFSAAIPVVTIVVKPWR